MWTFELLEERHLFSASPLTGLENLQWATISSSTPEGQELVSALEQLWGAQSSGASSGEKYFVPMSTPTDPYLQFQWHLLNVGQVVNAGQIQDLFGAPGQDINVLPAWDSGATGQGIFVAVVDTGVATGAGLEPIHPDLLGNISVFYAYDAISNDSNPSPPNQISDAAHGTAVAGLIGALANNGIGGTGVAFGATIVPIRFISTSFADPPTRGNTLVRAIEANGAPIDIYNHSWGPSFLANGRSVVGPTYVDNDGDGFDDADGQSLTNSSLARPGGGRNGLGAIHVFAAGNSAESYHSAGSNGYVNSRYTIGVGIVDHDGTFFNTDGTTTYYGEMAPSVLVVAPSASGPVDIINDTSTGSGIVTTDLISGGYNTLNENEIDMFPDTAYTARFGGTSAAAPLVSGVIALMLEANPNLTNRDVQEILVRSARQNDPLDPSWITNFQPLFRDPLGHNPFPDNFPIDPDDPYYPSDESQWNDEIVWRLVPAMVLDPANQAATGVRAATNTTFSVAARANQAFDGWVGNNLTVAFRVDPTHSPVSTASAEIIRDKILVTVTGDAVTWGQIKSAVEFIGQNIFNPNPNDRWFNMTVGDAGAVFDVADDRFILARLSGGVDARGLESEIVRAPFYEGYHPIFDPITNPQPDYLYTNGAGYTVSHGRHFENAYEYGYAHGVVDASLAVELARNWHLRNQNLSTEFTYLQSILDATIPIRAAEITNEESGEIVIPGAVTNADDGFADFFNEFFTEPTIEAGDPGDPMAMPPVDPTPDSVSVDSLPFTDEDPPENLRGGFYTVTMPDINPVDGTNNLMSVEWVEVHLNITGDASAMNHLRITLVSPDGTHSELTQQHYMGDHIDNSFQYVPVGIFGTPAGSITPLDENGGNTDELDWVYSTNRHWGERSDAKPIIDEFGRIVGTGQWELHFENYSETEFDLNQIEVAFHGQRIGNPSQRVERIMGKIGVDAGKFVASQAQLIGANDGEINFNRSVVSTFNSGTPFGPQEFSVPNALQEPFGSNVLVQASIYNPGMANHGQVVDQFITGADGNFYFDLPAGSFRITVQDSLGRSALADGANYDDEWIVTINTNDALTHTAGEMRFVPVANAFVVDKLYDQLNFLLDPGSVPADEVLFTGKVSADVDGDGTLDPEDIGVPNFTVYADLNHTGQFEIGEPSTQTNADGSYELHVPTGTPNTFSISIAPPTGWSTTAPSSKFYHEYALPGELVEGFDFLAQPPTVPTEEGPGQIFGFVYDDFNGSGTKEMFEVGMPGITIYIDADQNGELDMGEVSTVTTDTGAFAFFGVTPGAVRIAADVDLPFKLTAPTSGFRDVTVLAGGTVLNVVFGVENLAVDDFGDLVGDGFRSTAALDGPRHKVSAGFSLGARVDAELDSNIIDDFELLTIDPDRHGIGDDIVGIKDLMGDVINDEDGVRILSGEGILRPGPNTIEVVVNGVGGYLNAWFDFNDDGDFDDIVDGVSEHIQFPGAINTYNLDLNPGSHQLLVNAPANLQDGEIAARFRWGTINLNYYGVDSIGEVEDYLFETKAAELPPQPGDYNGDQIVDSLDYQLWKATWGSIVDLRADGNGNGVVDAADYSVWRDHMGQGSGGGGSLSTGGGSAALVVASDTQLQRAASRAAIAALETEYSLAAWLQRQEIVASAGKAWIESVGAQAVTVNGPNGPVVRYLFPSTGGSSVSPAVTTGGTSFVLTELPVTDSGAAGFLAPVNSELPARLDRFIPFSATSVNVVSTFGGDAVSSNGLTDSGVRLRLLDRVLAGYADRRDSEDDQVVRRIGVLDEDHDCDHRELALAAAFDEEVDWRFAI